MIRLWSSYCFIHLPGKNDTLNGIVLYGVLVVSPFYTLKWRGRKLNVWFFLCRKEMWGRIGIMNFPMQKHSIQFRKSFLFSHSMYFSCFCFSLFHCSFLKIRTDLLLRILSSMLLVIYFLISLWYKTINFNLLTKLA